MDLRKPPKGKGDVQPRICLRCNQPFPSTGKGNRICPDCSSANRLVRERKWSDSKVPPLRRGGLSQDD